MTNYTIDKNLEVNYKKLKTYIEKIHQNTATQEHVDYAASSLHQHRVKLEDFIETLKSVNWNFDKCFDLLRKRQELKKLKEYLKEKSEKLHANLRENDQYIGSLALQAR